MITHTFEPISNAAMRALSAFSNFYHTTFNSELYKQAVEKTKSYLENFNNKKQVPANLTRGACLALGCLHRSLLSVQTDSIISSLIEAGNVKNTDEDDPETRRNAMWGLFKIF